MLGWHFKPKTPGDTIREPIHGEFFATDAISDPGMALIREGIQNSLDAGAGGPVSVRVFVSGDRYAARAAEASPFLTEARAHLDALGNGLHREDIPDWTAPCPFVVFEDFGTQGLEGDPVEPFRTAVPHTNHFYHFFRAEGQTDKGSSQRGSWGVGKHVFWRSSRVSTVFGYTIRETDGARLLMGKSVLKCHWVGERYCQDGYYGVRDKDAGGLVRPISTPSHLDAFRSTFRLLRTNEPGLSIVVPWPDPDISREQLLRAVVHDYFYPILRGQLQVVVEGPDTRTSLGETTLLSEVRRLGGPLAAELEPLLDLAVWARSLPDTEKRWIQMTEPARAWKWHRELLPDELASYLRARFEKLERIAARVPVTIRKKDEEPRESFFDVFFVRDLSDSAGRPTFIREGVIIPRVDGPRTRGVRALVVADDEPVASFLRDAENPSHTEWQHDGSNFRGKYRSGRSDLTFVKRSVLEIVRILSETDTKEDRTLLADFFFLPADDAIRGRTEKPGEESGTRPPGPAQPRNVSSPFRVQKIQGGFAILPDDVSSLPRILEIRAAYDVRRGNPLKRYRTSDFRVEAPPIRFEPPPRGVELLEYRENRIVLEILDPRFSLHLAGFDPRRDLYVRVEPKEDVFADPSP
jgi:hypothetical protein